jgi:hypothetical protein
MDEKIEAFREAVLRWRGTRRKGARPYTTEMKAKALQLAKDLQRARAGDGCGGEADWHMCSDAVLVAKLVEREAAWCP